jgi:hypothetical protein
MFARVARYKVPQSRFGEVIPAFKESVEGLRELDGHAGGYLIVDPENCTCLTLTLWESRASLESSEMRATRLRREAIDTVDGEILSVETGEVALDFSQTAQV